MARRLRAEGDGKERALSQRQKRDRRGAKERRCVSLTCAQARLYPGFVSKALDGFLRQQFELVDFSGLIFRPAQTEPEDGVLAEDVESAH